MNTNPHIRCHVAWEYGTNAAKYGSTIICRKQALILTQGKITAFHPGMWILLHTHNKNIALVMRLTKFPCWPVGSCHNSMTPIRDADVRDGLQILTAALNILNKQRKADNGWFFRLGVGQNANNFSS
jgi:hypothetical protein